MLLMAGAEIDAKDQAGSTPLDEAMRQPYALVVDYLMGKGAKIAGGDVRGAAKQLEDAVLKGQTEIVKLLLTRGLDPDAPTANGSTLIHDACLKGHIGIAGLLLAAGASANALNASGATPLHDAALG